MTVFESFAIELDNFGPNGDMGPYSYEVRLYDTHREMIRAAGKYGRPDASNDTAAAMFQSPKNPGYNQHVGVLRFHAERLSPEFIVHECVHAAVLTAQCERGRGLSLPLKDTARSVDSEEMIAYAAGLLGEAILHRLRDHITELSGGSDHD